MLPSLETVETVAKGFFATAAGLGTLSAGLIYYGQNFLIYPSAYIKLGPERASSSSSPDEPDTPESYGLYHSMVDLRTSDGEILKCYLLPQRKELPRAKKFTTLPTIPISALEGYTSSSSSSSTSLLESLTDDEFARTRPTVIMFHGNGGTAAHRIPLGMLFQQVMRCNVFAVEYRGYGESSGTPSEEGFKRDAQAALEYVIGGGDERVRGTPVIIYGQSIGGAVGIDLASRFPDKIESLILENTFLSLPLLVPHVLPYLAPFRFLCHQKWESAAKVVGPLEVDSSKRRRHRQRHAHALLTLEHIERTVNGNVGRVEGAKKREEYKGIPREMKVLLLSGAKDTLVPPQHMNLLREVFKARPQSRSSFSESEYEDPEEDRVKEEEDDTTRWAEFEFGTHNDTTAQKGYWNVVGDFVAEVGRVWRGGER